MKLMIIDDHAGVRTLIRELVAAPGDIVWECADGNDAVRVVHLFKPDFVTVDIRMPGLDGFEVTRVIRTLVPTSRVVVVTAFDQPEFRRAAFAAGACGFVVKEDLGGLRAALLGEASPDRTED